MLADLYLTLEAFVVPGLPAWPLATLLAAVLVCALRASVGSGPEGLRLRRARRLRELGLVAALTGVLGLVLGLMRALSTIESPYDLGSARLVEGVGLALRPLALGVLTSGVALVAATLLERRVRDPARGHRGRREPRRRNALPAPLPSFPLAPLAHVLAGFAFFLLHVFEPRGELLCCVPSVRLPLAERGEPLTRAPVVSVDLDQGSVLLDGLEVATIEELGEASPDWKISRLAEQLEVLKHNFRLSRPGEPFRGEILIQADERVPFGLLKRVLYSTGLAGYGTYHLATEKVPAGLRAAAERRRARD